jgi:hypothetical protein
MKSEMNEVLSWLLVVAFQGLGLALLAWFEGSALSRSVLQ